MIFGERLKELREGKKMSQGDLEQRTGLLRCYTSRVENGHTVPSLDTINKYASALGIELYEFFTTDGKKHTPMTLEAKQGSAGRVVRLLAPVMEKLGKADQAVVLKLAKTLALAHKAR